MAHTAKTGNCEKFDCKEGDVQAVAKDKSVELALPLRILREPTNSSFDRTRIIMNHLDI